MSNVAMELDEVSDEKPVKKVYLSLFPDGIYGTATDNCYSISTGIPVENIKKKELQLGDYCWKTSAEKLKEHGEELINIEVGIKNQFPTSKNKKISLHLRLFHKEKIVLFRVFPLECKYFGDSFVINYKEEDLAFNFDDVKIQLSICIFPDGYVSDCYGTESHYRFKTRAHDAIIIVGDQKFYVVKSYMATWSKYFHHLFFRNPLESGKNEFVIEGVDPKDFELFLKIIHPDQSCGINELNVLCVLEMADQFDAKSVLGKCGNFLKQFDKCIHLSLTDRLELADKHKLISLQAAILRKLLKMSEDDFSNFLVDNGPRLRDLSSKTFENLYKLR